jgi:hypothetical protein
MRAIKEVLGPSGVRRVVLPGIIVSLGVHPFVAPLLTSPVGRLYGLTSTVLFFVEIGFFGLIVSSAATPIFYIYEGFRCTWLTGWRKKRHEKQVSKWKNDLAQLLKRDYHEDLSQPERDQADLLSEALDDFPRLKTDEGVTWVVERPTKLGNLISTYELYPESRYGIDGSFFWSHLMYVASESARNDCDESMDFAESLVLTSAAGAIVAIVGGCFLLGALVGGFLPDFWVVKTQVPVTLGWLEFVGGTALFWLFYELALPAYRETSEKFRALTDITMPNLKTWLKSAPSSPPSKPLVRREEDVRMYLGALEPKKK